MKVLIIIFFIFTTFSCSQREKQFSKLSSATTGINFINTLIETKENNVLTYEYFYNGSGVASGDLNGDGFPDLYFTGNQVPAKLYLNKGNFKFDDITVTAGVAGKNGWRTGVSFVDINADDKLDIYVCYSGFGDDAMRANELFINNGNNTKGIPTFTESALAYGIDAVGTYSSQALFFDYDRDGDLDMFLLNHAKGFYSPFFNTTRLRNLRHPQFGNRLYKNNSGKLIDVSNEASIDGNGINFGLGVAASDINNDGWPDLYVSNDFEEQDFCYINNKDGTFKEVCKKVFAHMSRSTMGLDIADYNNDLMPDVVTVDMLPEDNHRQKILQGADQYDKYTLMVDSGYGHQNSRNMLQLNRGIGKDSLPLFSEIGQLANVSNTDWSWSALLSDFDNDGLKDLFVSNGFLRDYTNMDFVKYDVANAMKEAMAAGKDISTREKYQMNMPLFDLIKKMPSSKVGNYVFKNKGDLTFSNESKAWGLDEPGVSSGASYADLDNDGDLDLIVCNNNEPVWVYKNNVSDIAKNNFIKIKLNGADKNKFAIGAKVIVTTKSKIQLQELYPVRGYQSSVDYILNFGIGKDSSIENVKIIWPDGKESVVTKPSLNKLLPVDATNASMPANKLIEQTRTLFTDITSTAGIDFVQHENEYVDFKREFLMPYQLSKQGPKMCKGDVNGDGREDIFIGAPTGQVAVLYLQDKEEHFTKSNSQPWLADAICEDIGATFFDADNDGDLDLYVVSGSNEWIHPGPELQDRIYSNDGKGNFIKMPLALTSEIFSGSCVTPADFDKDGDMDLFVGDRTVPGNYPMNGGNILLRNDFNKQTNTIHFTNVTKQLAGENLFNAGMVTDAVWNDIDKDGWVDLIITGDWMPVKIFKNNNGTFTDVTEKIGLNNLDGWWCKIIPADIDNDGNMDFIVGNLGWNTQFKPTATEPLTTYATDFNADRKVEPIFTWYVQGKPYLFNSRDEIAEQVPSINKKFLKYADYADATIENLFEKKQIDAAKKFYIKNVSTSILKNNGQDVFTTIPLPLEAQFSPVNGILYNDYDGDGRKDILISGNFFPFRVQQGRCDASLGSLFKGDGKGAFETVNINKTGLLLQGDVRDMIEVRGKSSSVTIVSKNNGAVQVIKNNQLN
jgi:enediyne biosynthesis protein E4